MFSFLEEYSLIVIVIFYVFIMTAVLFLSISGLEISEEESLSESNNVRYELSVNKSNESSNIITDSDKIVETESLTSEVYNDENTSSISFSWYFVVVPILLIVFFVIYKIISGIKYDIDVGRKVFKDPYKRITKFCDDNKIILGTDLMMKLAEATKTSLLYRQLVCDFVRCKTLDNLVHGSHSSDSWVVYFFYLVKNNFMFVSEDDLHSFALNYMQDLLKYYKFLRKNIGIIGALDELNKNLMLNLTVDDIEVIKRLVKVDKFDVSKKCKIDLIVSDDAVLESKYLDSFYKD